ncbi:MAG: NAD(P)/FAD-dependent oxidoreductase [Clostridium sp.]
MPYHDLIIVGGGASGLMSAILAKDLGVDVAIVEGTDRVGKKILTTGNGRCNISNSLISFPFFNYHSENSGFFTHSLNKFSVEDTKNFFLSLGLPLIELENGKLYPKSLQASSVVDILRMAAEERGINIYTKCKVKDIFLNKKFILETNNEEFNKFSCKNLLLACGGKSAIPTGSDGSGFVLAKSLGHTIIKPLPGIVQLKLKHNSLKAISGIKFEGVATLKIDNKISRVESGEILFTDYGISGPPILQLSSFASHAVDKKRNVEIVVDMVPDMNEDDLTNFLYTHFAMFSHRSVSNALIGIVNKKLIPTLLKETGLSNIHIPCSELEWDFVPKLLTILKSWTFSCIDTNGFQNAQVTTGGVNTKEVDNITLESKLVKNLYFCGEILDVDGDCGGFNLQWAWSSAFNVANNICKKN